MAPLIYGSLIVGAEEEPLYTQPLTQTKKNSDFTSSDGNLNTPRPGTQALFRV